MDSRSDDQVPVHAPNYKFKFPVLNVLNLLTKFETAEYHVTKSISAEMLDDPFQLSCDSEFQHEISAYKK